MRLNIANRSVWSPDTLAMENITVRIGSTLPKDERYAKQAS
jgi:hypothetical protein